MKSAIIFLAISVLFISCKKYLDAKTDKKFVQPASIQDAQAILENYQLINQIHPILPAQSDDDYYLLDTYFNSISEINQATYRWDKDVTTNGDWRTVYGILLAANTALETIEKIHPDASVLQEWKKVKGAAHFIRAYTLLEGVQVFADPYDKLSASNKPGIPLRLTSGINENIYRPSLQHTYDQVIYDLKQAAELLPVSNLPASRPSKPAAYAALARTFLAMRDYELAGKYADSCLQLYSTLLDYNTLNVSSATPFSRFNAEVLFHAAMGTTSVLGVTNLRIDSLLYQSYEVNDLRRTLFFQTNGTGTVGFKGSYDGNTDTKHFNGIATDEVYLIRAECSARSGHKDSAIADLNRLLKTRWKTGLFVSLTATDADDALKKVLAERRKELVIRGIRWFDLRRLNLESRFAKTLKRKINNQLYELQPNDPRYTFYIPFDVIALSGIQQNVR